MELDSTPEVAPSALPERIKEECHKEAYPSVQTCDEPQSQTATNYTDRGASAQDDGRRKGYSLWTLIAVGLATAIVVGAAVGGGLGSQLGRRQCVGSTQREATTITLMSTDASPLPATTTSDGLLVSYSAIPPSKIYSVPMDCKDGEFYTSGYIQGTTPQSFSMSCGTALVEGDVGGLIAYSFEDCMEACAIENWIRNDNVCTAALFHSVMTYGGWMLNCWMKNSSAEVAVPYGGDLDKRLAATAQLVT